MQEINLPPFAPVLMESTRAMGYSLESAIADLLDNSITAAATEIHIRYFPMDDAYIAILDDGCGMLPDELTAAMRYGSTNPQEIRRENDLGRFGLGLKTASLSQCRCLTVVSLQEGSLSARRWDLDVIKQRGEWILQLLDRDEILKLPQVNDLLNQGQGTLVIWRDLDRLVAGERTMEQALSAKMEHVREHLSLVFHRYLSGEQGLNKLNILMNHVPVDPQDPFLVNKSTQAMDHEIIKIDDESISVTPFILPHTSKLSPSEIRLLGGEEGLRRQQGFYVYRNRRLLVWGTWFRLLKQDELYKLARIRVDIPNTLDHLWTLDIRKSTAVPPEVVRKGLSRIIGNIADRSKKTWTFRGKKEVGDAFVHTWNRIRAREGVRYELNRDYPLIKGLERMLDSKGKRRLDQLLRVIESNLPVNALYVDLTNDEKIVVERDDEEQELLELAEALLYGLEEDAKELEAVVQRLSQIEPFSKYPNLLELLEKRVGIL